MNYSLTYLPLTIFTYRRNRRENTKENTGMLILCLKVMKSINCLCIICLNEDLLCFSQ